jgi:hypothetical protein
LSAHQTWARPDPQYIYAMHGPHHSYTEWFLFLRDGVYRIARQYQVDWKSHIAEIKESPLRID